MFSWMLEAHQAAPGVSHRAHAAQDGKTTHQDRILMMMTKKCGTSGLFLLLLFLLLLSSIVSGLGTVVKRYYWYIANPYTWLDAQSYCRRSHYTDLAIISTQSDADLMNLERYYAWIGLYKEKVNNTWIWTNGQGDVVNAWQNNEPHYSEECAFVYYTSNKFYGSYCRNSFFFFCYATHGNHSDHQYTFIPQTMTWSEAQKYCKSHYDDLASFNDTASLNSAVVQEEFPVWTGLHKDGNTWKWSLGSSEYRNWASNEPRDNGDCVSIFSLNKSMATRSCSARLPFICFRDNLVLVKENKTWEEALEHCRALSYNRYELVSVQPGEDHNYVMIKVMEAITEKVWTGLHFLAGRWLWVNKANMLYSDLPLCPPEGQRCGALSQNDSGSVETTDCSEKRNFLCYRRW